MTAIPGTLNTATLPKFDNASLSFLIELQDQPTTIKSRQPATKSKKNSKGKIPLGPKVNKLN
jgi:hypothetical protein